MEHLPTINLIAAVAEDGAIGKDDQLLWKIPADLEFYKAKTLDNVVVMGEKTFESLPKVAFKGRAHVVVSEKYSGLNSEDEKPPTPHNVNDDDVVIFSSNLELALESAKSLARLRKWNVFVAGGASIYEQLMSYCDFAFITWVKKSYPDADKFFPLSEFLSTFDLISEGDWSRRRRNLPKHKFSTYKNKSL